MQFSAEIRDAVTGETLESFSYDIYATELFPDMFALAYNVKTDILDHHLFISLLSVATLQKGRADDFSVFSLWGTVNRANTRVEGDSMYMDIEVLYGEKTCLLSCRLTPNNYERERIEGKSTVKFNAKCNAIEIDAISFGPTDLTDYSGVEVKHAD